MLHVLRASEGQTNERTGQPIFEGEVFGRTLSDANTSQHLAAGLVHFAVNARTRMHTHTSDQLLYILNGIGKVGDEENEYVVSAGDSIVIPAGTPHWHGAGDTGAPMTHITVQAFGSKTTVLDQ